MAEVKSRELGQVIATRSLRMSGRRRPILVQLGAPSHSGPDEWRCPYNIALGRSKVRYGYGVDSFQALCSALGAIYRELLKSKRAISAEFASPGITGFSPVIPFFLGSKFFRKIELLMEHEIAERARVAQLAYRQARGARPRKRAKHARNSSR
jgi:hypothetical protein